LIGDITCSNVGNINAQDITNTASNITANNLDITANNLNIATQQNTTDLKAGGGDNYSNSQSTKHQGSNLKVTGEVDVVAGYNTVLIGDITCSNVGVVL
jgi:uncharacterized protein with beta-barrel porin domain